MSIFPQFPGYGYIISGVIATFVAVAFSAAAPFSAPGAGYPQQIQADGTISVAGSNANVINRAQKGDRLPLLGGMTGAVPVSTVNTTIIRKNAAKPGRQKPLEVNDAMRTTRPPLAPLPNCEALASPFADPVLGRIVGRCMV